MSIILLLPVASYALDLNSGTCGTNLTWTFDQDYNLTISGTGDMFDYSSDSPSPWNSLNPLSVTIEEGVLSVGDYAFYNLNSIGSFIIPASVRNIGEYAFGDYYGYNNLINRIVYYYFKGSIPVFENNCFFTNYKSAYIYYPAQELSWICSPYDSPFLNTGYQAMTLESYSSEAEIAKAEADYLLLKDIYFGKTDLPPTNESCWSDVTQDMLSYISSSYSTKRLTLPTEITYEGLSLTLDDTVMIRHFFTMDLDEFPYWYSFTVDGNPVEVVKRGPYFTVDIPNISYTSSPYTNHTLTLLSNGREQWSLNHSVMSYVYKALTINNDEKLCNLMKAFYLYSTLSAADPMPDCLS